MVCADDQTRHRTVQMVGVHALEDSFGGDKPAVEPFESAEQEKARKNEKYNLRKSLAWDSAFFTSAGTFFLCIFDMLDFYIFPQN